MSSDLEEVPSHIPRIGQSSSEGPYIAANTSFRDDDGATVEDHDDTNQWHEDADTPSCSIESQDRTSVDPYFLKNHLKAAPPISVAQDIEADLKALREAKHESAMYQPAGAVLTTISKKFFDHIDGTPEKTKLLERHKYLKGKLDTPLTFIDHHGHAPTQFPTDVLSDVKDAPDLLAVFKAADFVQKSTGDYKGVPHHRVVSVVEAKSKKKYGGRAQAASYAYRHQQARPDHPIMFGLSIKPQEYQVILSSPNGIVASQKTPWNDLDLLFAYVYAHYDPRDDHFLDDDTISWNASADNSLPSWNIKFKNTDYTGHFVFVGDPWGRRTTVLRASSEKEGELIFKEIYRHDGRRFKEEDVLKHIHADGDIPGVVRLKDWEYVHTGGEPIEIGSGGDVRRKVRLALLDHGERVRAAKSVNDMLMAFYDMLEVHRTIYVFRKVIHRDMSMYNILMYPRWAKVEGRRVFKDTPPFIKDVLDGCLRPLEERTAACLMIDGDNAAILDDRPVDKDKNLADRTGTPLYIARSVCIGKPHQHKHSRIGYKMPTLTGEAMHLYVKAYGQARYDRFAEKDSSTCHGAIPPSKIPKSLPAFVHRPCHDAESIFWTMFAAFLRAQPIAGEREQWASKRVADLWKNLHEHEIPDQPDDYEDHRESIFHHELDGWAPYFHRDMGPVAELLYDIRDQVAPEYEYWTPRPPDDHLHEAMQRLILQYLVDHRDKDIKLDPDNLRPTEPQPPAKKYMTGSTETGSKRTRSRASTASKAGVPTVVNPKRKSESQDGRDTGSKRFKGSVTEPAVFHEEDEAESEDH